MTPKFSIIRLGRLGLFAVVIGVSASAGARTFTDLRGLKIEADVIDVTGGDVTVRLASGKTAKISISRLIKADRDFLAEWQDKSKAGAGDGSKTTPATPANLANLIGIDAKKARVRKGEKTQEAEGEITKEWWAFAVEIRNKSQTDLEGLKLSYRIYVDNQASKKLAFGGTSAVAGGDITLDKVARGGVLKRNTDEVLLNQIKLDADFEFTDRSRSRLEDKLEGVWIKIWQGDRKVGEFKSNDPTVTKAKWPDDEPADEEAE
jgi:hypothetical protein